MGTLVLATKGQGKSRALGRIIAFGDFLRRVPLVILDPLGGTIDNFLDKILRLPITPQEKAYLFSRIRYVDMAGSNGRIVPWPIYAKTHPADQPHEVSRRFVDVLLRLQPKLEEAVIQGAPRVVPLLTAAGIILSGLELGITEVPHLITKPKAWEPRLQELLTRHPESEEAVGRIREHALLGMTNPRAFEERTEVLLNQLSLFRFPPNYRAIFGATTPAINWQDVVDDSLAVLLNFRHVDGLEKRFCLLWLFHSLRTFIKRRGHGRHTPLSFIIDELSYLTGSAAAGTYSEHLATDLDELINQLMRSHRIWLTVASQEQYQFPERVLKALLSIGNVIFGGTSDPMAARELAHRFYPYEPYLVKKTNPVWMNVAEDDGYGMRSVARPTIVDYTTEEFSMEEQANLNSQIFTDRLPTFHFMVGSSPREGMLARRLKEVSIEDIDRGQFVDEQEVLRARAALMQRDGVPQHQILAAIRDRLPRAESAVTLKPRAHPELQASRQLQPTGGNGSRRTEQHAEQPKQLVTAERRQKREHPTGTKTPPLRRKPPKPREV